MSKEEIKKIVKQGILIIAIIFAILLLFGSIRIVKSGQVGVKTRFGKVLDVQTHEGVNFKWPLIEKIVKMNTQVQKEEVKTTSASKDLQDVSTKIAVNYRVVDTKAKDLYKNIGNNYDEIVLQPAIQESIKAVTSKYTAEELITKRNEVSKNCITILQSKIDKYGLSIDNFNITNFNFSEEFNKAIEEKQVAEQKVLTAKQQLEKAKVDAEKKIVSAKAEKQANELKQKSLTNNIVKEKFIEKWNGELPKVYGANSIMNIDSLLK